ncbi:putative diguanylate cyclase YcdT [Planctomycetes bacterium Pan216]|uniref:diguanylate cyclase n=1 Tax=Kolteria novifilia TaxID=2527975 RepID=A0A518AZ96_9BACT|nr:putative diguanylate cyclase YcdT [Planctomycetes bacterium Pan216]
MSRQLSSSPPATEQTVRSRFEALDAIVASGLTMSGLARVLGQWIVEGFPIRECTIRLTDTRGFDRYYRADASSQDVSEVLVTAASPRDSRDANTDARNVSIEGSHDLLGDVEVVPISPDALTPDLQEQLVHLVRRFGFLINCHVTMERARAEADRDELTGLYNRRFLRRCLRQALAEPSPRPMSLLMLDVDHFKKFNDSWGHAVGDRVLRLIGELMQSIFRSEDIVCRYGGEEFAVLLCDDRAKPTGDHPHEVRQYAERLRREAEHLRLTSEDGRVLSQITISGGIASVPWDARDADELLLKADDALYIAKRSGRNQIVFSDGLAKSA